MIKDSGIDSAGLVTGANLLTRPAEEFENDQIVEAMWAVKAFEHGQVYFNILQAADPRFLRLTPNDDAIYFIFRSYFPAMKIDIVDEDEMKSAEGKTKWRLVCEKLKNLVEDYSFGTLLRIDSKKDYTEENSMLTTRAQFCAVEIARNREGYNDEIRNEYRGLVNEPKF